MVIHQKKERGQFLTHPYQYQFLRKKRNKTITKIFQLKLRIALMELYKLNNRLQVERGGNRPYQYQLLKKKIKDVMGKRFLTQKRNTDRSVPNNTTHPYQYQLLR